MVATGAQARAALFDRSIEWGSTDGQELEMPALLDRER
jgi:hypothetical protein